VIKLGGTFVLVIVLVIVLLLLVLEISKLPRRDDDLLITLLSLDRQTFPGPFVPIQCKNLSPTHFWRITK